MPLDVFKCFQFKKKTLHICVEIGEKRASQLLTSGQLSPAVCLANGANKLIEITELNTQQEALNSELQPNMTTQVIYNKYIFLFLIN